MQKLDNVVKKQRLRPLPAFFIIIKQFGKKQGIFHANESSEKVQTIESEKRIRPRNHKSKHKRSPDEH